MKYRVSYDEFRIEAKKIVIKAIMEFFELITVEDTEDTINIFDNKKQKELYIISRDDEDKHRLCSAWVETGPDAWHMCFHRGSKILTKILQTGLAKALEKLPEPAHEKVEMIRCGSCGTICHPEQIDGYGCTANPNCDY